MSRSDGRGDLPNHYRAEEIERRLDHILRVGRVVEVDYERATTNGALQPRIKVQIDDWPSAWLPIASPRNGPNGEWDPFEVNEQVLVFAPSGVTAGAVVWGTAPRDMFPVHPKAEFSADRHLRWYKDLTTFLYDRARHAYEVDNPNAAGHHWLHITDHSEIHQDHDVIRQRINGTYIEVRDGSILLSVNGDTTMTLTPGLLNVQADRAQFSGDVVVAGSLATGGSITATGGIATAENIAAIGAINAVGPISSATLVTAAEIIEAGGSLTAIVAAAVAAQLAAQAAETAG